jgi:hypothetical protein
MAIHASTSRPSRRLWWLITAAVDGRVLSLCLALTWGAELAWRLHGVPSHLWRWRDDAVITLSHAYGLVHLGTVSVSTTGSRVEGFSSPLEFVIAVFYFLAGGHSYERLLDGQVVVCALIAGYAVHRLARHLAIPEPEGALLAAAVGFVTFLPWQSVGWFASGMENSLGVALIAVAASLWVAARRGLASPEAAAGALAALGLVRVELPVLLLPAVALFTLDAARSRGRRRAALSLGIIFGAWGAFTVARLIYFGSLVPNTAVVQDRVGLYGAGSLIPFFIAIICFATLWGGITVLMLRRRQSRAAGDLSVVLLLGLAPLLELLLLGPARLDPLRIAGMAALPSAVAVCFGLWLLDGPTVDLWNRSRRAVVAGIAVATAVFISYTGAVGTRTHQARDLCCDMTPSASAVLGAADAQVRATKMPRAIAANPDLGVLSFAKKVAVVDLGGLGDPLLALIVRQMPAEATTYLNRVATPDVVELHDYWACLFTPWARSRFFVRNYQPYPRSFDLGGGGHRGCVRNGNYAIWTRNLRSPEYGNEIRLSRDISRSPNPAQLVGASIKRCKQQSGDNVFRCEWVTRAVERNLTELDRRHLLSAVVRALAGSPSLPLDVVLLRSRDLPAWWHAAFENFERLVEKNAALKLAATSR